MERKNSGMNVKWTRWITTGVLLIGLAGAGMALADRNLVAPKPGEFTVRYYGRFSELSVGTVQPRGWIQKWLERQAQGLTGHPENMSYPYDTCMYAGVIPAAPYTNKWWSPWWPYEQSGYFVDGMTRLSQLVNDPSINRRRDANLGYILEHSTNGSLGPSHWCWPNAVVGRALLAEFSATGDPKLAQVLQSALLANADEITKKDRDAKDKFYLYRSGANFEEAYYLYGLTGDRRLLDIGRKVCDNYLKNTNSFCSIAKIQDNVPFHEHGVTAAEVLKCLPLTFLYTGDEHILRLARRAYQKVVDNSLMADGGFVSAEYLDPSTFSSLHESCDITDWSWSLGYLFMATGDGRWADLIERATFNALPGAVTKDFKQLQYFSAVNQVVIAATNSHTPHCVTRMAYRAAHDTECCAGNINRAMPNYVNRMWMRSSDGGLAAVYYGPSEVCTTVGGQAVAVTEETDYPFRDTVTFRVKTAQTVAFALQCRIPQWCSHAVVQVNGMVLRNTQTPGTFAVIRRKFHDGDVVSLKLPMPVRIEEWLQGQSVCVTRGPLVYSLKIAEKRVEHTSDPDNLKPLLRGHNIQGFPEVEFYPESDWRYGFDAALITKLPRPRIKVVESDMPENPFVEDLTPVHLEVPLYHLPGWFPGWMPEPDGTVGAPGEPSALPSTNQQTVEGQPVTMVLVPYGTTHLRLTTLPLVSKGN